MVGQAQAPRGQRHLDRDQDVSRYFGFDAAAETS
jgi:hypothetical protein